MFPIGSEDKALTGEQKSRIGKMLREAPETCHDALFEFYVQLAECNEQGIKRKDITPEIMSHIEAEAQRYTNEAVRILGETFADMPHTLQSLDDRLQMVAADYAHTMRQSLVSSTDEIANAALSNEELLCNAMINRFMHQCKDIYDVVVYGPAQLHDPKIGRVH